MSIQRKLIAASAVALALGLSGCWNDDDEEAVAPPTPPVAAAEVPASAGVSTASFFSFLLALSGSDDSSEPLVLQDAFAVPADESAEPTPLT